MGDAVKKNREDHLMDNEEEFGRRVIKQNVSKRGHGKASLKKHEKITPKKGVPFIQDARNGAHQNSSKSFSPSGRAVASQKDAFNRWSVDEQRSNSENWRDRGHRRFRKDSTNEVEDDRWQDLSCLGDGSYQGVGRPAKKGTACEDNHRAHSGESKMQGKSKNDRRRRPSELDEEDYVGSPEAEKNVMSKKELLGLQQAEERLKRDFIYRLKRRPRKNASAIYSCKLCDVLIESVQLAHKHIKERRHRRSIKEKKEEQLLTTLPPPTLNQIEAITESINKIVQENGLDEDDLAQRLAILKAVENQIQQKIQGCTLRLYGSSLSRFGFRRSDLNIDVKIPPSMNQPDVLLLVQESLKQSDLFTDFDVDFHARVPVVVFREKQSGLLCKVSAGNENTCLTTELLAKLGRLEPRIIALVVAFRYWAKLCRVDRHDEGGLPPYVFALMVVYFLQHRKEPVLPVYFGTWVEGFSISKLGQYHMGLAEEQTVTWEYAPADETTPREECTIRGKVPLVFPADRQCPASIGQLWIEMLRFYALEFNMANLVISIRVKEKLSRETKDWPKKRIAVEDPYSVKRNVARSLNSQLMYEYMLHCLKATYKYFATPQKKGVKSNFKKTATSSVVIDQDSHTDALKRVPEDNNMSDLNKKLEDFSFCGIDKPVACAEESQQPQHNNLETDRCSSKKKLVYDSTNGDPALKNDGCVIEEDVLCDPEEYLQSCEELESCHEESEDDDILDRETEHDHLSDQGMEEDSENGEYPVAGNEETDSLSDCECFTSVAVTERGGFAMESCRGILSNIDPEEDSADELEEVSRDLILLNQSEEEEEEDEEEEISLILNPYSLTTDEELDKCTGSVCDIVSESEQISTTCLQNNDAQVLVTEILKDKDNKGESVHLDNVISDDDDNLFYEFNKPIFTRGKLPTVVCNLCKREGHLRKDCPEDFKRIKLDPLPPLTPKFHAVLDQVCMKCYEDFSPSTLEYKAREFIRQDLEDFIKREFPGARLRLFGSSKNGFGFKQSDLDICMTIDGIETDTELDCIRTIEGLAWHLRKHQGLRNILSITSAKVPIVKFYHVRSGIEGDISLYNTLALHNTQLLASYAAIDPRVKYLCYTMKVFTKMCDIGDASRGSLSSYAYTLMVLFFLQQRNPPVIPVLQEIYRGNKKPEVLVDGWNAYFFSQTDELEKYWPEYGKNKESVGELWLALLRYYTEEFDFKENVICIRRKSLLTTFKKQWTSKYIVIEDPFDLNHNLGAGLSRKMTNFIMKAFINGRRVFGTPVKEFSKEYPTNMEYFFDPEVLTEGELAPNDRCCRICGKIGHFMKECPKRRKMRSRNGEGAMNQRYPERRLQRRMEDTENENSGLDGKHVTSTPRSIRQGVRAAYETCKDKTPKSSYEKWRRQDDREAREKRCFICGREGHIKKDCPQYKGSAGSPKSEMLCGSPSASSPLKHKTRLQGITSEEDKKKTKLIFSPQSGSLSNKYMTQGKATQKKAQQES
ncbi:terminal uridylyltransferase 7 [Spea bombifrons]|uniref:terminal uridylyltransferase 7 n=1 Tax=Spea bombifrons TaxID=233779 RepID=UPI0023493DBE|nr:terminal uridylyltransferase 7 [Spea bombifrons]